MAHLLVVPGAGLATAAASIAASIADRSGKKSDHKSSLEAIAVGCEHLAGGEKRATPTTDLAHRTLAIASFMARPGFGFFVRHEDIPEQRQAGDVGAEVTTACHGFCPDAGHVGEGGSSSSQAEADPETQADSEDAEVCTVPWHGLRGFLRDRGSGGYLTVFDSAPHAICQLTDKATSLLVCRCTRQAAADEPTSVAFAHEGVPALGRFLSYKGLSFSWRGRSLHLKCAGRGNSGAEGLLLHADSTLQHKQTGLWLWADPETRDVVLHATKKSTWDILPAT